MENSQKMKLEATARSIKYQLKHKIVSLLTQQQMLEKELKRQQIEKTTTDNTQPNN